MNRFTLVLAVLPFATGCTQNRDFDGAGSTSGANTDPSSTESSPPVTTGDSTPSGTSAGTDATTPTGSATTLETSTDATASGSSSSSGSGDTSCVDLDLGTTIGEAVASGNTAGRANDYTTMDCLVSDEGTAFVGPDRSDQEDFIIAWTFPETGSYVVKSGASGETDLVIGVADASCSSEVLDCDDQCADAQTALVLTGRAGDRVHLIVEGFSRAGAFSISILEGNDPLCTLDETTSGEFGSSGSGGGFIAD